MRVFNYANYARAFEYGMPQRNMTKVAQILLTPVINMPGVVNQSGNLYTIDSQTAIPWYKKETDIPRNIKRAAGEQSLMDSIGDYFASDILSVETTAAKEPKMYSEMVKLVRESDLTQEVKDELLNYYRNDERPEFLGRALLYLYFPGNLITLGILSYNIFEKRLKTQCFLATTIAKPGKYRTTSYRKQ